MKTLVTREPWWANPPKPGQPEHECIWGYLEVYSDGTFVFDDSKRPSDIEIDQRKGCRLQSVEAPKHHARMR